MAANEEGVALQPCPFCGAKAELDWIDNDAPLAIVSCSECLALVEVCGRHGYRPMYEAQAIAAWNTRASQPPAAAGERALQGARKVVEQCRDAFDFYVSQHLAKQPADTHKAAANQRLSDVCSEWLAFVDCAGEDGRA